MYLLNLHFPGKSYELSSLPESLTNSSCKQNTKHVSSASLNGILSIRNLSALLHWCFQVSYIKFINNHYIKKKKTVSYKNIITKPLSIQSCLLSTNSTSGLPSLRKMHFRIVANSLLDYTAAAQLNTDCWICLWRARRPPFSQKKHSLVP